MMTPPKNVGPLLGLPPELREMIWVEVLLKNTRESCIFTRLDEDQYQIELETQANFHYPPLLQTCQQIRYEATRLFFRRTYFYLREDDLFDPRLLRWMKSLDQVEAVQHIRSIRVFFTYTHTLRGKLYCFERFLTWIDDHIAGHGFSPVMFFTGLSIGKILNRRVWAEAGIS